MGIRESLTYPSTAILASAAIFGAVDLAIGQHEIDVKVNDAQENHVIFTAREDLTSFTAGLKKEFEEGRGLRDFLITAGSLLVLRATIFEEGEGSYIPLPDYEESYE